MEIEKPREERNYERIPAIRLAEEGLRNSKSEEGIKSFRRQF